MDTSKTNMCKFVTYGSGQEILRLGRGVGCDLNKIGGGGGKIQLLGLS